MSEESEAKVRSSKGFFNLEHHQYMNNSASAATFPRKNMSFVEGKKLAEYRRSLSCQAGNGKKVLSISYFSLESFLLLLCLTASLLLLPLILPPLPPPPFMLLLLPILILLLLMFLAFMPSSNLRNVSYTYVSSP
ncbi:ARGOS-like protein [Nicotiana tomentosiformis]